MRINGSCRQGSYLILSCHRKYFSVNISDSILAVAYLTPAFSLLVLDDTLLDKLVEVGLFDSAIAIAVSHHHHVNLVFEAKQEHHR